MVIFSQLYNDIYLTPTDDSEDIVVPTANLLNTSDITNDSNTGDVTRGARRKSSRKEVQFEEMEETSFSRKMNK